MGGRGTAILDFGDGAAEVSIDVAAPGILSGITADSVAYKADSIAWTADQMGSQVEAWMNARGTDDHDAEEHRFTDLRITAGNIVQGARFTIWLTQPEGGTIPDTLMTGKWAVDWAWQ